MEHKGSTDKTTIGICGLKPEFWEKELKGNNPNSIYSGYLVLSYLINTKGDLYKALKHFKGAKKNLKNVDKVIELVEYLKNEN